MTVRRKLMLSQDPSSLYTRPRTATTDHGRRTMDKATETLLEALKQALTEGGEQRLYKSGKLPGLFAGPSGLNEEALRRADAAAAQAPDSSGVVPWGPDALGYLDRRRSGGAGGECPLPELFAALQGQWADLSVTAFHDGLRRLQDRRLVRLLPYT